MVAGFLVALWFSFGQNVLGTAKPSGVPERLGTLELISAIEGSEALTQINRLHGTDIDLVSAYIAEYVHASTPYHSGNERLTVWVGGVEDSAAAAELIRMMIEGIEKGDAGFSNLQRLTIAGHEVFRVDGPGGEHFFYNSEKSGERVVWLTVEADDTLSILGQVVETF